MCSENSEERWKRKGYLNEGDENMKYKNNTKHKYICVLLAVLLVFNGLFIEVETFVAADEPIMYDGDTLHGWQVDCVWENGTKTLDILSSRSENMTLKLSVTYYAPLYAMTQSYQPGTIKFAIPDFGVLKRSGASFKITTAGDQDDTDWNCQYDIQTQMYIFSNAKVFEADKPISGGFEMLWTVESRQSMTDFSMTESPIFTLENESTRMTPLTLNCETIRDFYIIDLQRDFLSYEQYEDPTINKSGYVSYNYKTYFHLQARARGGYRNSYFVKVSFDSDTVTDEQMSAIIAQYWVGNVKKEENLTQMTDPVSGETVWGFYRFRDIETENLGIHDFVISYPESLKSTTARVDTELLVLYYEENEYVNYTSSVTNEMLNDYDEVLINEYSFWYGDGNFSMTKSSPYEINSYTNGGYPPYKYSDRLLAKKIFSNERVTFTLGGSYRMSTSVSASTKSLMKTASTTSSTDPLGNGYIGPGDADLKTAFDFVLGDDRLSVDLNNGAYRMLESDEYTFTRVIGPNDSRNYEYELYVSNVGFTSETNRVAAENEYRLFATGKTGTYSVFDLTDIASKEGFSDYTNGVKAIYIKIKNFTGEYYPYYKADIAFHFNQQKNLLLEEGLRINTDGKITDYGFMRALYAGTSNDAFSIGSSTFLKEAGGNIDMQNFGQLMMYLDNGGYNRLLYHSMANVYLRDVVTMVGSETTVTSKAQSKEEGGGYSVSIDSKGTIKVKDDSPGELERFSLYVKIPKLLTINNRLSDIKLENCYAVNQLGEAVGNTDFENNVTYSIINLSDGDRAIVADFDFSENPLESSKMTYINMKIPALVLYTDLKTTAHKSFEVRTFTMIQDEGAGRIEGVENNHPPTYRQYAALDTYDFNLNGRTNEVLGGSYHSISYENVVEQWKDTAMKLVKSYRDDTWKMLYDSTAQDWYSETEVNAYSSQLGEEENKRATYSYRLSIELGSGASDILFSDVLESADGSEWRGTLNNIDFTYAISLGLTPSVYYSTQEITYSERSESNGVWVNNLDEYTSDTEEEWNDGVWTAPIGGIRSLVIRLSTAGMKNDVISKKQIYVIENLTAPELSSEEIDSENSLIGKLAINEYTAYYMSKNLNTRIKLDSRTASTKLLPPVVLIKMIKKDGATGKILTGAEFSFYTDPEGTQPVIDWEGNVTAQNVKLNKLGELVVDSLEPGTYWYKETVPPAGYHLDSTLRRIDLYQYDISYLENDSYIIQNERLPGKIVFTKKDADDENVDGLKDAVYALFDANGISVFTDENNVYQEAGGTKTEFATDDNGQIIITNLPWGNYYLLEQSAPAGYDMNDTKVWANVSRNVNVEEQTENDAIVVYCSQADTEQTASIRLTKYDRDGVTPLANAWFALERKNNEGDWVTVSGYEYLKTGRNGIVTVEELKFGTYRFKEIIAPTGYELDTNNQYSDEVTLNAQTIGTTQKVTKTNERILGSACLRKYSDDGIPLNGAKFDLYMVNGEIDTTPLQPGDTEDIAIRLNMETKTINGQAGMLEVITGLDWGKYYFKEFSSPSGYNKDETIYSFEITAENAAVTFDSIKPVNERKKGEVILNKIAGEPVSVVGHTYSVGESIPNAEFTLFTSSGESVYVKPTTKEVTDPITHSTSTVNCYTVCESADADAVLKMTTNADGQIRVDGICWGNYYFEETKAPDGFALGDKVRFTVNASSCLAVQELECEDFAMKCLIRIDKEIDNKLEVFGTPTFTFKVVNTDTNEDYTRMITLSGDSLSGTATVQVPVGNYMVSEVRVSRYKLTGTEYVEEGTTVPDENRSINENVFFFNLSSDSGIPQTAEVKFYNTLDNYSQISHTDAINNIIPSKSKITGFSLELKDEYIACTRTEHNTFTITKDMLTGIINYDDGTSIAMTDEQIAAVLPQNWTVDNGYLNAEQSFMLSAQFTEESKNYKTNFVVTIGPYKVIESQKVIFRSDINNSCAFNVDGKQIGINTVYYNDDSSGAKTAVSGQYVKPVIISGEFGLLGWEIISGSGKGTKLYSSEQAVKDYLAANYDSGLRELELRAVIGPLTVDYDCTETVEEFIAPKSGIYFLEGWGAQGGGCNYVGPTTGIDYTERTRGGYGGYSYGYIYLEEGEKIYVAVGGQGGSISNRNYGTIGLGGFNGGGNSKAYGLAGWGAGGGATHFASSLVGTGVLSQYESAQDQVLLVAGAGGGGGVMDGRGMLPNIGGCGGGLQGQSGRGNDQATGGSQTSGFRFGQGGQYTGYKSTGSGGGGGWYGGYCGYTWGSSGGGGSGHVNTTALITGETIYGNQTFTAPDGSEERGHSGDGHARITYIAESASFTCTETVQAYTAPKSGNYLLEAWGAQGGSAKVNPTKLYTPTQEEVENWEESEGGRGGYSYGTVYLNEGDTIYVTVGGKGDTLVDNDVATRNWTTGGLVSGGYNGGGNATGYYYDNNTKTMFYVGSGGGATHFALTNKGILKNYSDSKSDILLVAGGGGGSGSSYNIIDTGWCRMGYGGAGGGTSGLSTYNYVAGPYSPYLNIAYGGTQSAGGTCAAAPGYSLDGGVSGEFGQGGYSEDINSALSGGGGGWYGGGSSKICGGGGGSGHVNTTVLISGETIAGNQTFTAPYGGSETGHTGDGFARITYMGR